MATIEIKRTKDVDKIGISLGKNMMIGEKSQRVPFPIPAQKDSLMKDLVGEFTDEGWLVMQRLSKIPGLVGTEITEDGELFVVKEVSFSWLPIISRAINAVSKTKNFSGKNIEITGDFGGFQLLSQRYIQVPRVVVLTADDQGMRGYATTERLSKHYEERSFPVDSFGEDCINGLYDETRKKIGKKGWLVLRRLTRVKGISKVHLTQYSVGIIFDRDTNIDEVHGEIMGILKKQFPIKKREGFQEIYIYSKEEYEAFVFNDHL